MVSERCEQVCINALMPWLTCVSCSLLCTCCRILSFGPRRYGPNILLNHVPNLEFRLQSPLAVASTHTGSNITAGPTSATEATRDDAADDHHSSVLSKMIENGVVNGFQMAAATGTSRIFVLDVVASIGPKHVWPDFVMTGPLCAEPLMGVCFVLEDLKVVNQETGCTC